MPKPRESVEKEAQAALRWLERRGTRKTLEAMETRYGIHTDKAFGVPVGTIRQLAKELGRDHELAADLWDTGWYEARLLAAFVDEPEQVTAGQMDRWCRDFDNWAVVDTVCFALFDRTPHAYRKVEQWSRRRGEFAKRAAFALLACLALHDKAAEDERFLGLLPLIEGAATDKRNFVKKGVSWALRAIGKRNAELRTAATELARRLAEATEPTPRWLGKTVLRDLAK